MLVILFDSSSSRTHKESDLYKSISAVVPERSYSLQDNEHRKSQFPVIVKTTSTLQTDSTVFILERYLFCSLFAPIFRNKFFLLYMCCQFWKGFLYTTNIHFKRSDQVPNATHMLKLHTSTLTTRTNNSETNLEILPCSLCILWYSSSIQYMKYKTVKVRM